jgi:hypothetical protein
MKPQPGPSYTWATSIRVKQGSALDRYLSRPDLAHLSIVVRLDRLAASAEAICVGQVEAPTDA